MKAVDLMETLANAVVKNPKTNVSFMIGEEDIKDFAFEKIEGTNFFNIGTGELPEEDLVFIFLKKE